MSSGLPAGARCCRGWWAQPCEPRAYSWQQFGQLATTTPTVTAITKITTSTSPISHCRRKNLWLRHLITAAHPVS